MPDSDQLATRDDPPARSVIATSLGRIAAVSLPLAVVLTALDLLTARRYRVEFASDSWIGLSRAHVAAVLALGLSLELSAGLGRLLRHRSAFLRARPWFLAVLGGAVLAAPGAFWLANALASGDWVRAQSWVGWFRLALVLTLVTVGALVGWWTLFLRSSRFVFLGLVVALVLSVADRRLLVGLYEPLHIALYVSVVVVAWLSVMAWVSEQKWRLAPRWSVVVGLVPWLWCASSALSPLTPQVAALRLSSSLKHVAAGILPPASQGLVRRVIESQTEAPWAVDARESAELKSPIRIRNVLVVVVDTLRADALPPVRGQGSASSDEDTPFVNKWLETAQRFESAYSAANRTRVAMPAAFRSRQPFDLDREGLPLALRAQAAGLSTHALVPGWFFAKDGEGTDVLDGFDDVRIYDKNDRVDFAREAKALLKEAKQEPFFVWLHYFGMHAPYIADKPHRTLATPVERYRAALRTFDGQMEQLVGALRRMRIEKNTLVVLMSDHGEMLGEFGLEFHGRTLLDAEIHVPLALWIPGAKPSTTSALVGNIDIVPTIFDLLGQPTDDMDGRSLVPTLASGRNPADVAYYVVSGNDAASGLVTEERILTFDHRSHALSLYDRADRAQARNLLGADPVGERIVLERFVETNPRLFEHDLKEAETLAALTERLDDLALDEDSRALEVLLRFASVGGSAEPLAAAARAYDRTRSAAVKRRIFVNLAQGNPAHWHRRAQVELEKSRGRDEIEWLRAMSKAEAPLANERHAVERLLATKDCRSELARAWFDYLGATSSSATLVAPLTQHLDCVLGSTGKRQRETTIAILNALARLPRGVAPAELATRVGLLLEGQHAEVSAAAAAALGALAPEGATADLRRAAEKATDKRVVVAAVRALGRSEGSPSTPYLVDLGTRRRGRHGVIQALTEVGDARAVPALEQWAKSARGSEVAAIADALAAVKRRPAPTDVRGPTPSPALAHDAVER